MVAIQANTTMEEPHIFAFECKKIIDYCIDKTDEIIIYV